MATTFHKTINNAEGILLTTIDSDDTSIVLEASDGGNFPATGPFWITIGDEIVEISSRSSDTLTVAARGDQDTAATSHDAGAVVELLYTAEQITELQDAINEIEAGNTTLEDVNVSGGYYVDGSPLASTDLSDAANIAYTNAAETFSSNLDVGGNLSVTGTAAVTSSLSCDSINVGGGYGSTGATISNAGNVSANGTFTVDGAASFASTIAATNIYNNGGTGSTGAIASGSFSLTLTSISNVGSASGSGRWIRVGQVVFVSLTISVAASASGNVQIGISLPIASNLGYCTGSANAQFSTTFLPALIVPDTTNDRAEFRFNAPNTSTYVFGGMFAYNIA